MCCTLSDKFIKELAFTGCGGDPYSDEFITHLELEAVENEDFKLAILYRDELIRRNEEINR